jgi:hypothetical protein
MLSPFLSSMPFASLALSAGGFLAGPDALGEVVPPESLFITGTQSI